MNVVARVLAVLALLTALAGGACGAAHAAGADTARAGAPPSFDVGADISSLTRYGRPGPSFTMGDFDGDAPAVLHRAGFTSVRIRIWHSPADGQGGLDSARVLARRVHELGMRVFLDLHYSDTWADPGHQSPPAAWRGLPVKTLADSVRTWTRAVMDAFASDGVSPDLVQIGNEIDGGMLWDTGRVGGAFDTPAHWRNLARLLSAGTHAVRAGAPHARIVLHVAAGGDVHACRVFFEHLRRAEIPYDIIGVSYYSWWHGPFTDLEANLRALAWESDKDVAVVETAYPWTTEWFDDTRNVVGPATDLPLAFPASPDGQARYVRALVARLRNVPDERCVGVWWWEPAWIARPGVGSPWENCTLFDDAGVLLPAGRAFGR